VSIVFVVVMVFAKCSYVSRVQCVMYQDVNKLPVDMFYILCYLLYVVYNK